MKVRVKKINEYGKLPTRGSEKAAGYDVYAATNIAIEIPPHQNMLISTGIALEIPDGTFVGIFARSGLATKQNLRPSNCVGVLDSDYRGPVLVSLHNDSDEYRTITPGERIGQLILLDFNTMDFEEVDELTDTERGQGGFGSTGTH